MIDKIAPKTMPIDCFRYRAFFVLADQTTLWRQGEFWIVADKIVYEKPGVNLLDELGYDGWELIGISNIGGGYLVVTFKQPFRITV